MYIYYTVYRTINLINGKEYIGVHKTKNPNDAYLGSGKNILKAISKYGEENFKKEVLFMFDNVEDMLAKEAELVNEEYVKREDTYNLVSGGIYRDYTSEETLNKMRGSNNPMYGYVPTQEQREVHSTFMKERWTDVEYRENHIARMKELWKDTEYRENKVEQMTERWTDPKELEAQSIRSKIMWTDPAYRENQLEKMKGRKHTEETKKKMSEAKKGYKWSEEAKERFSKILKESGIKKHDEKWCQAHAEKMTGENNPMYGRNRTTEEKEKMSKNRLRLECPYCGKIGVHHLMKRYHFENCKNKENILED